jgi:hypothetical protein
MTDPAALSDVMDFLSPDDFHDTRNGLVFGAMLALYEQGQQPNIVAVADRLNSHLEEVGGAAYLATLTEALPMYAGQYGQIVARKAALRRLIGAAAKIAAIGHEDGGNLTEALERAEAEFRSVATIPSAQAVVVKVGLGFRMDAQGYVFRASRITEARGEVSCHLEVEGLRGKVMRPSRVNLSTPYARKSLSSGLAERAKGARVNWLDLVERFAGGVIEQYQAGDPTTRVGLQDSETEMAWLIDGFMPADVATVLYGPQKIRKSTLAQIIAVGCETGVETVPGWRFHRVHVCALDWEADATEWNRRIRAVSAGIGIAPPGILYRRCSRPLAEQVEELAALGTTEHVGLWIVDATESAVRRAGDNANPAGVVEELYAAQRVIGGTWLLVDHVSGEHFERDAGAPIHKPLGSVRKLGLARAAWELKAERNPNDDVAEILLRCEAMNGGPTPRPMSLRIHYGPGTITVARGEIEAPELVRTLATQDQMSRFLWQGAHTDKEIANELECPEGTIRQMLHRFPDRFVRTPDKRIGLVAHE